METEDEQAFVWFLLSHGPWDIENEVALSEDGNRTVSIIWIVTPPVPSKIFEEQGLL
jgi:hypothetical protein